MLKVYSYGLKPHDIEEIEQLQPDVILLSGEQMEEMKNILKDATLLTELSLKVPFLVVGNGETYPEIKALLNNFVLISVLQKM